MQGHTEAVRLICDANEHEHLVGPAQVARLVGTPCPWCQIPLHATRRHADRQQRTLPARELMENNGHY